MSKNVKDLFLPMLHISHLKFLTTLQLFGAEANTMTAFETMKK